MILVVNKITANVKSFLYIPLLNMIQKFKKKIKIKHHQILSFI